jgi:hypothetical protein
VSTADFVASRGGLHATPLIDSSALRNVGTSIAGLTEYSERSEIGHFHCGGLSRPGVATECTFHLAWGMDQRLCHHLGSSLVEPL